jgi:hypothetical protein
MKQLIALSILALAAASNPVGAAGDAAKTPAAVKASASLKSLDPAKGRFHQRHVKKLKLACTSCHSPETKDNAFLRRDEALPAGMPGQVDRSACLGCHQEPAKPSWYKAAAR